jgi:hypothetical protein
MRQSFLTFFGNTAYRFEHVDGSLVLPIKVGGGHHLLGDVHMVSDNTIGELINMVKPLFMLAALLLAVIMPPIPRYVFVGCCRESGHSTNVGSDGYSSKILEACLHFRKVLKTSLVGSSELGRFWVSDTLACVGSEPSTMQEKLDALRPSLGGDGVHLTDQGRFHLFNSFAKTVLGMRNGSLGKPPLIAEAAASSVLSGRRFYWRGSESDSGSTVRPAGGRGWRGGRSGSSGRGESRPGSSGSGRQRATPYTRPEQSVRGGNMRGMPRGRGRGFSH